jgi:hypothetical protein
MGRKHSNHGRKFHNKNTKATKRGIAARNAKKRTANGHELTRTTGKKVNHRWTPITADKKS